MIILDDIKLIDLSIFLEKTKTLIISDIHIGYEESLNKQGFLIPRHQFKLTYDKLNKLLKKTKPKRIIINGDLKHEFGIISQTEWVHTLKIIDLLLSFSSNLCLIKGNHDNILDPITKKRNIEIKDYIILDNLLIIHGNKLPENNLLKGITTIIIGHEHPAISIENYPRTEKFKCFILGKYKSKNLLVLPSFNLITTGTNILKEKLLSPFLNQDMNNFNVYIIGNEIFDFGKIKDLKNITK
ncbi:MAG: metallophosphoesterase [Nanoarchaeota archaeon]